MKRVISRTFLLNGHDNIQQGTEVDVISCKLDNKCTSGVKVLVKLPEGERIGICASLLCEASNLPVDPDFTSPEH